MPRHDQSLKVPEIASLGQSPLWNAPFLSLTGSLSGGHFLAELLLLLFVITARYLRGCLQRIEKASDKLLIDLKGARAAETRCSHSALM